MVKKRDVKTDKDVEIFASGADKTPEELSPTAPRGKKRGGTDRLVGLNAYENQLIVEAAEQDSRPILSFIRLAAVEKAKEVLGRK